MRIVSLPPSAEALAYSKEASPADELVGRSILFNWPVVGWCVGKIMSRNYDARKTKKIDGAMCKKNFNIYYDIDDEEVGTVLRANEYDGDEEGSWVLLAPIDCAAGSSGNTAPVEA